MKGIVHIMENAQAILALMEAIRADLNEAAERGPSVRVEFAAQVAELANAQRDHNPLEKSEDYLTGYVDGFERAAALIRMLALI